MPFSGHFKAIRALLTLCWHYVDTMLTSFATFKHPLSPASPLDPSLLHLFSHDNDNFVAQNLTVSNTAIGPTQSTPSTSRSLMILAVTYTGRILCCLTWKVAKFPRMASSWTRFGRGIAPFVSVCQISLGILFSLWNWSSSRFVGGFAARAAKTVFCASLRSLSSHAVSSTSINFASAWVHYFPV